MDQKLKALADKLDTQKQDSVSIENFYKDELKINNFMHPFT